MNPDIFLIYYTIPIFNIKASLNAVIKLGAHHIIAYLMQMTEE